jgi:hypothetical protein
MCCRQFGVVINVVVTAAIAAIDDDGCKQQGTGYMRAGNKLEGGGQANALTAHTDNVRNRHTSTSPKTVALPFCLCTKRERTRCKRQ